MIPKVDVPKRGVRRNTCTPQNRQSKEFELAVIQPFGLYHAAFVRKTDSPKPVKDFGNILFVFGKQPFAVIAQQFLTETLLQEAIPFRVVGADPMIAMLFVVQRLKDKLRDYVRVCHCPIFMTELAEHEGTLTVDLRGHDGLLIFISRRPFIFLDAPELTLQ
jgi:hypothetical protein